jgi:hypothetical protein
MMAAFAFIRNGAPAAGTRCDNSTRRSMQCRRQDCPLRGRPDGHYCLCRGAISRACGVL